jgi:hypothetical protein
MTETQAWFIIVELGILALYAAILLVRMAAGTR